MGGGLSLIWILIAGVVIVPVVILVAVLVERSGKKDE